MNNSDMPAMPIGDANGHGSSVNSALSGLTKREAFVMAAMQGLCANPIQAEGLKEEDYVAAYAVRIADATLAELEK